MCAYCRRATHGNPDDINWSITEEDLSSWVLREVSLIQKIWSGKGILEPIGGKFNLEKAETKNFLLFSGYMEDWVRCKREMRNRCDLDGYSRAIFGGANGKKYVPSGDMDKTVFADQKKFLFEVLDVRFKKGKARNIIMKHLTTKDVYAIWTDVLDYYDDPDRLCLLIVALNMKAQRHEFTNPNKEKEYVEEFETSVRT